MATTTTTIKTTFQLRRGLKLVWETNNPILAYGEPGFEKDTYKLKIGDGITHWNDLPYVNDDLSNIDIEINAIDKEQITSLFKELKLEEQL